MDLNNQIIIYQTEDGQTQVDVRLENETVWLTQLRECDGGYQWFAREIRRRIQKTPYQVIMFLLPMLQKVSLL